MVIERPLVNAEDPEELLESLVELHRFAASRASPEHLELYHRASVGIRVELDTNHGGCAVRSGRDDGIAVRVQTGPRARVGFAATTGADRNVVDWALAQALEGPSPTGSGGTVWPPPGAGRVLDHDAPALPAPEAVEAWLRRAWSELERADGGPEAWFEGVGRAEVARTVESWVSRAGLRASRSRTRAWAVAQTRRGESAAIYRRPLFAASRTWDGLEAEAWARLWADRGPAEKRAGRPAVRTLLLSPEASGELVANLARALHGSGSPMGARVGPGWKLVDDPLERGALHGGLFDDSGFPTAPRPLADGEQVVGSIDGPGHLRRASFRDPPAPLPARLRVESVAVTPPRQVVHVSSIVIHPYGDEVWTIEVAGPDLTPGYFRLPPLEMARRCVGTAGPARTDHRGVSTPSLLLDDVEILSSGV